MILDFKKVFFSGRFENRREKRINGRIIEFAVKSKSVKNEYIIELPDSETASRLCGANDKNLKIIESTLNVPVYLRGNLLSITNENAQTVSRFKFVVERLLDEIADGSICSEDLVKNVLLVPQNRSADFRAGDFAISIFGAKQKIYPRTNGQAKLVDVMRKNDLVFASGPAGSGKTFIAIAEALSLLLSHRVDSLILTRPVVEAGENLGFLPGSLEEKINPYLRPLFDAMNICLSRDVVQRLIQTGVVEIAPLAYMRGRTLSSCAVILDEAQNTTSEQMKMFLTRMGEGTKLFITGDETQVDLPKRKTSGFSQAQKILFGVQGIGFVKLTDEDVVRSELVRKIVRAYEAAENLQKIEPVPPFDSSKGIKLV